MSITVHPELESKLRARAQAEGLTVEGIWNALYAPNRAPRTN